MYNLCIQSQACMQSLAIARRAVHWWKRERRVCTCRQAGERRESELQLTAAEKHQNGSEAAVTKSGAKTDAVNLWMGVRRRRTPERGGRAACSFHFPLSDAFSSWSSSSSSGPALGVTCAIPCRLLRLDSAVAPWVSARVAASGDSIGSWKAGGGCSGATTLRGVADDSELMLIFGALAEFSAAFLSPFDLRGGSTEEPETGKDEGKEAENS